MKQAELEAKYKVRCYTQWRQIPANLHTRKWFEDFDIKISKTAQPDAIKGGGMSKGIYLLFAEEKYLNAETLREIYLERRPVI